MKPFSLISAIALATQLSWSASPAGEKSAGVGSAERLESITVLTPAPPVLRRSEPVESRVIVLPGRRSERAPEPKPARVVRPFVPVTGDATPEENPALPESAPDVSLAPAAADPAFTQPPAPPLRAFVPVPVSPFRAINRPVVPPPAPDVTLVPARTPSVLNTRFEKPAAPLFKAFPAEFGKEPAIYCQRHIGQWALEDARKILGEPRSQRPATDGESVENGRIYAFADPAGRYRELELDFDSTTGHLRTVFVYPWKMTWQDCQRLWGTNVTSAEANKGRKFHSYLNRRLDVLVAPGGDVISLGLY